jgi:hypothetical protein
MHGESGKVKLQDGASILPRGLLENNRGKIWNPCYMNKSINA